MHLAGERVGIGDVFRIPVSDDCCGFGQVLARYKQEMLLMVVFSAKAGGHASPSIEEIVQSTPLFICNSFDARIWHGHWPIVGTATPDREQIPLPKYKVKIGSEMHVESYDADRSRICRPDELALLEFRKGIAPVLLENALKAQWGFAPWNESYDSMRAELALIAARIRLD